MSSYERNMETEGCTGWCNRDCSHRQGIDPVGGSQTVIVQEQYELANSDARQIMEMENQRNASQAENVVEYPALQYKKARASDLQEVQNRRSTCRAKGTEKSEVDKLNRHLQEEKAKFSKMEEAARRQKQGLEAKVAELSQQRRAESEASRRKERGLEAKVAKLTEASRRREKDMEQLKTQNAEMKRLLHEKTAKLSKLEEDARQNSTKERESRRLVAELKLRLQEKTVKPSNTRRNSTKKKCGEQLEAIQRVAELETKVSGMEDDAKRREQENRDLSAKNQEQSDEINQLKARAKTLSEQATELPSKALVREPDSISIVEMQELLRILNAQIEQLSNRIADPFSDRELPGFGAESAAFNDLRDYLGPRLFNDLSRGTNRSETNLILPTSLQTVLIQACSRIINHWDPPFWNNDSVFFRVYSHMGQVGPIVAGTWSGLAHNMSQSEVQEANVEYLSKILVKMIAAIGGLPNGQTLPPEYQGDVEDIVKNALKFRYIVGKEVKSMDLVTYTIPSDTQFNPSQMIDEGTADGTRSIPRDKIICTLGMGLQYRKLGESSGGQCGVIMKPKVVLPAALEA